MLWVPESLKFIPVLCLGGKFRGRRISRYPSSTPFPFLFWGLLKLNVRKKGSLIIRVLLGNLNLCAGMAADQLGGWFSAEGLEFRGI